MVLDNIEKRDWQIVKFDTDKIYNAIKNAIISVWWNDFWWIIDIVKDVKEYLKHKIENNNIELLNVEDVQDAVESILIKHWHDQVAKAYILYRAKQKELRKTNIFEKRLNLKPYEYPQLYEYVDKIRESYWIHSEFNFTWDIQSYKNELNDFERNVIKNTMLAISQIEVAVKTFWLDIWKRLPKPEISAVGATFWESEVRHADAYSHLLELLWLNWEFSKINEIPALKQRVNYLETAIKFARTDEDKDYTMSVLLFSLFIEHVSLFSQFLIMMSFNKYKNLLKWISNAVEATSKEEQIHWYFWVDIINIIRNEHPEWFWEEFIETIIKACKEAYNSEMLVLDWILDNKELDFLPRNVINEFLKKRFNNSLQNIWIQPIFDINNELVNEVRWFDDELLVTKAIDFFDKKSINYTKRAISITAEDLFDD